MAAFKNLQIEKAERIMNLLALAWSAVQEYSDNLEYDDEREMKICRENFEAALAVFESDLTAFCAMFADVIDEENDNDAIATLVDYLIDGTVQD